MRIQLEPGNLAGFYVTGNSDGGTIETNPTGSTQAFHASGSIEFTSKTIPTRIMALGRRFTISGMDSTGYDTPVFGLEELVSPVTVNKVQDGSEDGLVPVIFSATRSGDSWTWAQPLEVALSLGGTANPGVRDADGSLAPARLGADGSPLASGADYLVPSDAGVGVKQPLRCLPWHGKFGPYSPMQ